MKKLPKIRWVEDPNLDKLFKWLKVRRADIALREAAAHEADATLGAIAGVEEPGVPEEDSDRGFQSLGESADSLVGAFDPDIQVGDIRLLSPQLTPNSIRPVYVAVFKQWKDELVLVAPFSPYSLAATRTELELPGRMPALRVVCPWNAHTVHPISIADSWLVDRLSESELVDIWQIFRHAAVGHDVPEGLFARVGCPIMRTGDPRVAYQTEEADLMGLVSALNLEVSDPGAETAQDEALAIEQIDITPFDFESLPLAARSRESQSVPSEEYRIAGLRSHICLYGSSTSAEVILMVYERNGDPSRQLDFSVVSGPAGERLATIRNGMAKWKATPGLMSVGILLPSGQRLKLFKRGQ